MKYLVLFAFIAIITSLVTALFFMMKKSTDGKTRGQKMALALAVRVGISILLFASILIAWKLGFINPTGIPDGR